MTLPQLIAANGFTGQGLHVMSKPIGPICNLDCAYCYYLHKEDLYPGHTSWRMSEHTLETYIQQYIDAQPQSAEEITFAWQGGEPTLLGVDFFERVVEVQQRCKPPGRRVVNTLQTNGVLLDDVWCRFFKQHEFLLGLSIDGPADLHDRYRVDTKGRATFPAVMHALNLLKAHAIEFNALVVVNRVNGDQGRRVYRYLRDNGLRYLQFIPIVERQGVGRHAESVDEKMQASGSPGDFVSSRSVLPDQFGRFLIEVFEEWFRRDVGRVFVQIFDQALAAWLGMEPSLCVFRKQCGRAMALEHNGDLYSCDHFVEPAYKLGNIHELPIVTMANSERQQAFGSAKESTLPRYCRDCEVRFACNGECPKNRFLNTPDGEEGLNYLCAGYRAFFNHIDPTMKQMAHALRAGRPASDVMEVHRQQQKIRRTAARSGSVGQRRSHGTAIATGRNAFCPCGSGRKFKHCCGTR